MLLARAAQHVAGSSLDRLNHSTAGVCNANGSSRLDASDAKDAFSSQAACEFVARSGDSRAADIELCSCVTVCTYITVHK
jgi:hypothetical protein